MVSRERAAVNSICMILPLASALFYVALFDQAIPNGIIIPIAGGGIMNLGFWVFYNRTIGPIHEISRSVFGRQQNFLLVGMLHLAAIPIALIFDVSWIPALF